MATEPLTAACTLVIDSGLPSGSVSLPSRSAGTNDSGVSTVVEPASSIASGAWFGASETVMLTVAVSVPPLPSETVYVKEAGPV